MKKNLPLKPSPFFPSMASFAFFLIWCGFLYAGSFGVLDIYHGAAWEVHHVFLSAVAFIGFQAVVRYVFSYFEYLYRVWDMNDEVPLKIERMYRSPLRLTILLGISSGSVQIEDGFRHTPLYQGFIGLRAAPGIAKTGPVLTYTTKKSPEHVLVISLSPVKKFW